jgi:hypothetical protein
MREQADRGDRTSMPTARHRGDPVISEVRHLEQVAEVGESDKTPLILTGGVALVSATVFLVVLTLATLAYRLAS